MSAPPFQPSSEPGLSAGAADAPRQPPSKGAPKAPWRHKLEYFGFRAVAGLFSSLPVETASALSGRIWRAIAPLTSRHKRAHAHLLAVMPELPPAERERIIASMWENLGRTFAEAFHLRRISDDQRIALPDPEVLARLLNNPKGGLLCGLHMGNWELYLVAGAALGLKAASVYQKIKNPLVDEYVTRVIREPFYAGGVHAKGPEAARHLMRYARGGGYIALLSDLRDNRGITVPFFGRPAPSTPFPALMARALDIPIFAACIVRENGVRFRILLKEIEFARTDDREADVLRATAALQAQLEAFVRACPEQWMWAHRRWG